MGQAKAKKQIEEKQRQEAEARRAAERLMRNTPKGRRGWIGRTVTLTFVKGNEQREEKYFVYPDRSVYWKTKAGDRKVHDQAILEAVLKRYDAMLRKPAVATTVAAVDPTPVEA